MHLNIVELVLGLNLVACGFIFLRHFRKLPDSAESRKWRKLSVVIMILGWLIALWDPMFALGFHNR
jgi:hypothetical protein